MDEEIARMSFEQSVVIVTGAAGNLGSALTRLLAARGAHVVGMDRDAPARVAAAPGLVQAQ